MRPAALLLLPAVLLCSSAPALGDASDLNRVNADVRERELRRTWLVVEYRHSGGNLWGLDDLTIEFGEGEIVTRRGKVVVARTPYVADGLRNPPWLSYEMVDAIYRIHGDTLSIYCGARGRRPTAFRLDGADHVVTLKRVRQP